MCTPCCTVTPTDVLLSVLSIACVLRCPCKCLLSSPPPPPSPPTDCDAIKIDRLVEEYPERGVSWFAVGCYYLCTRQFEIARRYFGKATTMGNCFAAAWIGFGHAFAFQDESDQVSLPPPPPSPHIMLLQWAIPLLPDMVWKHSLPRKRATRC